MYYDVIKLSTFVRLGTLACKAYARGNLFTIVKGRR
jgi:hypothetical protein